MIKSLTLLTTTHLIHNQHITNTRETNNYIINMPAKKSAAGYPIPKKKANAGNRQATRIFIEPSEKEILVGKIVELRVSGESILAIAKTLDLAWKTVDKYYKQAIDGVAKPNAVSILSERILQTSKILDRTLKMFHMGDIGVRDVQAAIQLCDEYNGLTRYLDALQDKDKIPLLEIIVMNVDDVKLPPSNATNTRSLAPADDVDGETIDI